VSGLVTPRSCWSKTGGSGHYFAAGSTSAQPQAGGKGDFVRASEFIGTNVRNAKNEQLGKVDDFVMDTQSGEVRYAVLGSGGILGIGEKLFAVPLSQFEVAAEGKEGKELVLPADKERVQKAEGFKKANWPMTASRDWLQ
jgi:sporulation protein YlmC with PRC-barrel domain